MHYAIIGCIHGNRDALTATLEDIRQRGIERVVCLGDVVGFGPDPIECLQLVRDRCFICIRGDHDEAMLTGSEGFIPKTGRVLDWTRERVNEVDPTLIGFLDQALSSFESAGISFVHGSPRSAHEYLFPSDVRRNKRKLRAAFAMTEKVCFNAHTHVAGVISEEPLAWYSAKELDGYYHYRKGVKALINVGSVGQPRDGDPRACYLEIRKNEIFWRRVEYDLSGVLDRLQSSQEVFAPDLAIRLAKGR